MIFLFLIPSAGAVEPVLELLGGGAIDWTNMRLVVHGTGGGNTGGMYMYNCGNGQFFGGTGQTIGSAPNPSKPGPNGPGLVYNYANSTTVCFVVQPGNYDSASVM